MKRIPHLAAGIAGFALLSCTSPEPPATSLVTTLGKDTMVIEQFRMSPGKVTAEVMMRTPRTTYSEQTLTLNPDGSFREFSSATFPPDMEKGEALEKQTLKVVGDSIRSYFERDTLIRSATFAYDPALLPWADMVHWPYEVATRRMVNENRQSVDQPMLSGREPAIFEIRSMGPDSVSIKHPYRGTMYARLTPDGGLEYFDATGTTRKLVVQRGRSLDVKALARKYADRPIGSLSGEGITEATVHEANIQITFGQPARRGRQLFGGIVPWGEVWRTGANRATHLKTDKDLKFEGLDVPAGEYTLFTTPKPDGGTLIINKQTGQNGNNYDASMDLGRVPMRRVQSGENVELFTIDVIEREDVGLLQVKWGSTIFETPFEVLQ